MKILIQVGNLGASVIDHLITPIIRTNKVKKVLLVCRKPGPGLPGVKYYVTPRLLGKIPLLAIGYEFVLLLLLSLVERPAYIGGFLLNPHGILAFITAKLTRKKVIISLIAGRPELFTKGSIENINFEKDSPGGQGKLLLLMLKHSDAVITTGSITKNYLAAQGVNRDKIYPIISPANKARFFPTPAGKVYDVISVGDLSYIKHQEVLLYAVAEIKKARHSIKACFLGEGNRKTLLNKLAEDLGISENVDFLGFQRNTPYYYNISKIFVHTSEREGFPNVVLEAMLCGLPCIVSNCGDIVDVAKDGYNSIVIPNYDDYQGYAGSILRLLDNAELYRAFSLNALKSMEALDHNIAGAWKKILN